MVGHRNGLINRFGPGGVGQSIDALLVLDGAESILPPIHHRLHICDIQTIKCLFVIEKAQQQGMKKSEKLVYEENGTQMREISNSSDVRYHNAQDESHQLEISEDHRDNVQLNQNNVSSISNAPLPAAPPPAPSVWQRVHAQRKLILKWTAVAFVLVFMVWLGSNFLSEGFVKSRKPMFLSTSSNSKGEEVMSPQQSDYRSFQQYEKMVELAKNISAQNRDATEQEIQELRNVKFKQFFNSYKVIRTIQLGKQFSKTPKEKEELGPLIDETSLDQVINMTDSFLDAVDQFRCSSCYSFPIAATVEYLYKRHLNITVKLSEQQLIDCAHDDPNANGCNDGNITKGFEYVMKTGLVSTEEYPYRSITGQSYKCDNETIKNAKRVYKISGFRKLPSGNCQAIQSELIKKNAVAAMMNGGDLNKYTSGTFTDCKRFGWNHAITIVGQTEKNQWIVRNSWGKSFGMNGYFIMGHGNTCGVCAHSIVPVLKLNEKGQVLPYDPKEDQQQSTKE